jgi:hypothetical protein
VAQGVSGKGGGHPGAVQEIHEISSDCTDGAFDHGCDLETAYGVWGKAAVVFSAWSNSQGAEEEGLEPRVGKVE